MKKDLSKLSLRQRQRKHFDNKRAEQYENAYDYRSATFNWMVSKIDPILRESERAIDLGAGTGDLVRTIKTKGYYIGMDVSPDMLRIAREKSKNKGIFIVGDGYDIPFLDRSFDRVTMKYYLHHLDDPEKTLREARRILHEDGIVVIGDVASYDDRNVHQQFKILNCMREPANYEYRSIDTIINLLTKTGFHDTKVIEEKFNLILEDWLDCFYEPANTISFVLDNNKDFQKALSLKRLNNGKHLITLKSFVAWAQK